MYDNFENDSLLETVGVDTNGFKEEINLPVEKNNIKQSFYNDMVFDDALKDFPDFKDLVKKEDPDTFGMLMKDFLTSIIERDPEMQKKELIDPKHRVNRAFVEELLDSDELRELHSYCTYNETSSVIATLKMGTEVYTQIEQDQELRDQMQKAAQAQAQALLAQQQGNTDLAQQLQQDANQAMQKASGKIANAVQGAAQQATQDAKDLNDAMAGMGLDPADLQTVDAKDRLQVVKRMINNRVLKLAKLIGQRIQFMKLRIKKVSLDKQEEIFSLTQGNNIKRAIPRELSLLTQDHLKPLFYQNVMDKKMLQHNVRGKENLAKGPMIACIDASGSMSSRGNYSSPESRIDWAIATAMALVDIAHRQRRPAYIIIFNESVKLELEFSANEKNVANMLKLAEVGAGGGTNYEPALKRGMEIMKNAKEFKKADIVLISDGECGLRPQFRTDLQNLKKKMGFRIWALLTGTSSYGDIDQWADKVWAVEQLSFDAVGDVFDQVV